MSVCVCVGEKERESVGVYIHVCKVRECVCRERCVKVTHTSCICMSAYNVRTHKKSEF